MIRNKIITLSKSFEYTDYYSEFIKYKNKKIKIIIKLDTSRISAHIFLFNNNGLFEIATGSDFEQNIRDFDVNDNTAIEIKRKYIRTQLKLAKEFITKIF